MDPSQPKKSGERGGRKLKHVREQSVILLGAFAFAVFCKAPVEIFATFATALAALSGAFVYGNTQVHKAQAAAASAAGGPA